MNLFSFYFYLLLDLIILSSSQISKVFPVYKIILTENIDNLFIESYLIYNAYINTKGIGIVFDKNSDINIMPMRLFRRIEKYYRDYYYDMLSFETGYKDDFTFLILDEYYENLEVPHFILEDKGIIFPLNELFKKDSEKDRYNYIFLGKENQENIVIGKDLINTMNIEFKNNDFFIHNDDFVMKLNE